ncbi:MULTISPECIES: sce7725 family protein [unclassified Enterococcus]|jgi:hypothetical protein|uniref:sce7725 family protein n=1 Tax=unclassified Enterococcus TaxID=2608891 RepID=UPI003D2A045A
MYYPYLRGKQFDLLALKESLNRGLLSSSVHPVIEPVRDSATLKNVVELFQKKEHSLYMIENPQVGQFKQFEERLHQWEVHANTTLLNAWIIKEENLPQLFSAPPALAVFDGQFVPREAIWKELTQKKIKFLVPDSSRFRLAFPQNKIILDEAFEARRHVEDYEEKNDDFFSDAYLFYQKEGYIGFSDFTIESSRYFDKGFPSRALALHITYIDAYGNLRVKHFVSDNNESAKDQAGKFFEAAEKLKRWVFRNKDQLMITEGLLELLMLYENKKFPGLGVLKKWTLMHHLELVSILLDHPTDWLRNHSRIDALETICYS